MRNPRKAVVSILLCAVLFFSPSARDCLVGNGAARSGPAGMLARSAGAPSAFFLESQYRSVWRIVAENYMYPQRLGAWDGWVDRFDGRLRTAGDLKAAIGEMLASLEDEYTFLRDEESTRRRTALSHERDVVQARMLESGVAYLRIRHFLSDFVADELAESLSALSPARAYVVDLRGNAGGMVDQSARAFAMLCPAGVYVTYEGRSDGLPIRDAIILADSHFRLIENGLESQAARDNDLTGGKPLVVLVDRQTRSAAEILAGALHDNGRARLVGQTTFGKGIIQKPWQLANGLSMKVAIARYFLPGGKCIDGRGIRPDHNIAPGASRDSQLDYAVSLVSH